MGLSQEENMIRRTRFLTLAAIGLLAVGGLAAAAAAQGGGGRPHEVPGPATGPSGQTGELHYFENKPKPWDGTFMQFGPFRILPPGIEVIVRDDPFGALASAPVAFTNNTPQIEKSPAHIAPVMGYSESQLNARLRGVTVTHIEAVWSLGGATVIVMSDLVPESALPLDEYSSVAESPFAPVGTPVMIGERYAIVSQPKSGPAPHVGYVRMWLDGSEVWLRSDDVGQDTLVAIAKAVAASRVGGTR
jgi:hypothetical protein